MLPERAAFPKTKRNHALPRAFRGDPLNQEAHAENQAAAQPDDFPRMNRDPEDVRFGEKKLKAAHSAEGSAELRSSQK